MLWVIAKLRQLAAWATTKADELEQSYASVNNAVHGGTIKSFAAGAGTGAVAALVILELLK